MAAHARLSPFFVSSRRRHTRCYRDWSSDVCSSDLRRADQVITDSAGIRSELLALGQSPENISVIYNPLDFSLIDRLKEKVVDIKRPFLLFAGRLNRQKNIPLLLNVFSKLATSYDLMLVVLGKGAEFENLMDLVHALNLVDRVIFKGFSENPYKYMHR